MPSAALRLLIVDDDVCLRRSLIRALDRDTNIDAVASAEGAQRCLEDHADYDVVLCDHDLPGQDGVWLLTRARELCPSALRILMSGRAIHHLNALVRSGLVQGFLLKPFDPTAFQETVRSTLAPRSEDG